MSLEIIIQAIVSGLLMGFIYALIAAGLSLIFGMMGIVNFVHGEFLIIIKIPGIDMLLNPGVDLLLNQPGNNGLCVIYIAASTGSVRLDWKSVFFCHVVSVCWLFPTISDSLRLFTKVPISPPSNPTQQASP